MLSQCAPDVRQPRRQHIAGIHPADWCGGMFQHVPDDDRLPSILAVFLPQVYVRWILFVVEAAYSIARKLLLEYCPLIGMQAEVIDDDWRGRFISDNTSEELKQGKEMAAICASHESQPLAPFGLLHCPH